MMDTPLDSRPAPLDISGYLSVQEYARAVGVHPRTVRRRIGRGELAAVQVVGEHGPEYRLAPPAGYSRPYTPPAAPGDADRAPAPDVAALLAQQQATIAQQQATIAQLTEVITQLAARLPALPPGPVVPALAAPPDPPAEPPPARRWRWPWQRGS